MPRPQVVGPEAGPENPFPIKLSGRVIKGFGRGSKELGIPTANIPITGLDVGGHSDVESGVYYGWAGLSLTSATSDASQAAPPPAPTQEEGRESSNANSIHTASLGQVSSSSVTIYPMVMSIGWNPFYKNTVRSVEIHIIHKFAEDFYNASMNVSILGFIRPEKDYDNLDSLVEDIKMDIRVAETSVNRPAYQSNANDQFLQDFAWAKL